VLPPIAWLMVGHCAGLPQHPSAGDFVLRRLICAKDHVLDDDLPVWVPNPLRLAENQIALEDAVETGTQA